MQPSIFQIISKYFYSRLLLSCNKLHKKDYLQHLNLVLISVYYVLELAFPYEFQGWKEVFFVFYDEEPLQRKATLRIHYCWINFGLMQNAPSTQIK
jgi:hypothetical protein